MSALVRASHIGIIQSFTKRTFLGCVRLVDKFAFCLPTASRGTQFLHTIFTQSGKVILVQPCIGNLETFPYWFFSLFHTTFLIFPKYAVLFIGLRGQREVKGARPRTSLHLPNPHNNPFLSHADIVGLEGGKATKPSPAAAAQLVLAPTTLQAEYPNFVWLLGPVDFA